jgi:hypothetical protein
MIAMIATTIISSINVKPLFLMFLSSYPQAPPVLLVARLCRNLSPLHPFASDPRGRQRSGLSSESKKFSNEIAPRKYS